MPIILPPWSGDEELELDPVSEDAANTPVALIGSGIRLIAHSYPAPPLDVQYAGSVDTEGDVPASRRYRNRTITLQVECESQATLESLEAKVAKIGREGGTLKRVLANGETVVYDLIAHDGYEPTFDQLYHVGGITAVALSFPARPLGRGPEEDMGDNVETALPLIRFTETIPGNATAQARLVIDNDVAADQRLLVWAYRSGNYSADSTAALFYEAESCALGSGAATAADATASGGTRVQKLSHTPGTYETVTYLGASSTAQTHVGSYRVFARIFAPITNTSIMSVRCSWQPYVGAATVSNTPAVLEPAASPLLGNWILVDLGIVSLPSTVIGSQGWLGWIESTTTASSTDDLYVDWVALMPVDEGYGEAVTQVSAESVVAASQSFTVRHDGQYTSSSGGYWTRPRKYEGDNLTLPPGQTAEFIVLMARGNTSSGTEASFTSSTRMWLSPNIDDLSARLYVTARYLVMPEA